MVIRNKVYRTHSAFPIEKISAIASNFSVAVRVAPLGLLMGAELAFYTPIAPLGLLLRAIGDFIIELMIEDSYASTIGCDCPVGFVERSTD